MNGPPFRAVISGAPSFWSIERDQTPERATWSVTAGRPDGSCWYVTGTAWWCARMVAKWVFEEWRKA